MNLAQRPGDHECFDYHRDYVAKVADGDILTTLRSQQESIAAFLAQMPEEVGPVVHPPYGWSVWQVIEHCIEAERVFGYRTLRFAAGDKTDLPGWDENHYAATDYGPNATLAALASEFMALRQANICLLARLTPNAWDEVGTADGRKTSVRTLSWLMAGHWLHHEAILRKRLTSPAS